MKQIPEEIKKKIEEAYPGYRGGGAMTQKANKVSELQREAASFGYNLAKEETPTLRWVKASERLPSKQHNYHVRVAYTVADVSGIWNTASVWNGEYWEDPTKHDTWTGKPQKINVIEWLEEIQ